MTLLIISRNRVDFFLHPHPSQPQRKQDNNQRKNQLARTATALHHRRRTGGPIRYASTDAYRAPGMFILSFSLHPNYLLST